MALFPTPKPLAFASSHSSSATSRSRTPAFRSAGVEQADLEPVLLIECPRYLFPFARKIIADVTADGGYPPFLLDPIDFAGVYAARKAEAANQVAGNA